MDCVRLNTEVISKVEEFPFDSFFQVIGFYLFNNPARARYINLLEVDRNAPYSKDWLDEGHPNYRWAIIAQELDKTLRDYPHEQRQAFIDRYLRPIDQGLCVEEIAEAHGRDRATVFRWLSRIRTDLEYRFYQRGLMPLPVRLQN